MSQLVTAVHTEQPYVSTIVPLVFLVFTRYRPLPAESINKMCGIKIYVYNYEILNVRIGRSINGISIENTLRKPPALKTGNLFK